MAARVLPEEAERQLSTRFSGESLFDIVGHLRSALEAGAQIVSIEVPNPDLGQGHHAGERVGPGRGLVHRPLRAWCDLAEGLGARLLMPLPVDATHVELRFQALGEEADWQSGRGRERGPAKERYGAESSFARVRKLEDPGFLLPWMEALSRIPLQPGAHVLDLGVNRGDELLAFDWLPGVKELSLSFVGVDHSPSVLAEARRTFPESSHRFLEADLNALPEDLGEFSLVISVGTLQSPGVDDGALLRRLVQRHLAPDAALLLGFPNCRFRDGELVYGARVRNLSEADLSLLVKDLAFYRRYLHQHGFRTFLGGKYELLLSAVRTRSGS